MEHLQIAYDLFVIMIGLAALSIVVFWAIKTRCQPPKFSTSHK